MRWLRNGLVAVGALVLSGGIIAVADYFATQPGSGTSFGSVIVSAIHYAKMVIADPTTPTQVAAVSAGGALKVDGSAATQPVSGTVTANAGTNLNTSLLATAAKQPALGTAGTASTDVLTVQGIASMTPLGVSVASGGIASGAIASGAIASGAVASGAIASGAFASGSFLNATAGDPCMFQPKTNVPISTASGTVALVTGVSAKKIYVCSLSLIAAGAISVSLAEGSSSTCGTSNQAAVIGVATSGTAANGMALPANGGLTIGNGGGVIAQTATAANYLCLFQSGTTQIAGNLTYVQQ